MSAPGGGEPARPPRHAVLPTGTLVGGRYRVEAVIGEGSQSVVYRARAEGGDPVALKVIHRHLSGDPMISQRFQREALILRRLEGEHVVRLLDVVEEDGLLAIALELVEGASLEAMLAEHAPLDLGVAIEIILQVCAALGAAHANGIIHRDLKTANVLVERPAGRPSRPPGGGVGPLRVKVVDFGLSKVLQSASSVALTEAGMIFGTPEYMAPEQARGDEVDARADLYAAGVMLYEMVVGAPPFSGRSPLGTMSAHLSEAPLSPRAASPGSNISPGLEAVMLRALAKDPADRFGSARELAQAIAAVRDQPLVITPRAVENPELMAVGDTDLHLVPPSFGQARTLRADELAAVQALEIVAAPPAPRVIGMGEPPEPPAAGEAPAGSSRPPQAMAEPVPSTLHSPVRDASPRPTPRAPIDIAHPEILDEPTAVSGLPPRRTGMIWAIVAIVAAAVGVVIGVLVGTR